MSAERIWRDRQVPNVLSDTVMTMRRIRTAATTETHVSTGIVDRIVAVLRREPSIEPKAREVILYDAEKLGTVTGNFFGACLADASDGEIELEEWRDTLSDARKQYDRYKGSTLSKAGMSEVVRTSIIGRLRCLNADPNYMLRWELTQNNNLGAKDVNGLLRKRPGILSPLSGDFILASSYRSYLERRKGGTIEVKPVAMSQDLKVCVMPKDQEGKPVFEQNAEIGIYIDTTDSGKTGKALYEFVTLEYSRKKVHMPRTEGIEFKPSKKMQDAMSRAAGN